MKKEKTDPNGQPGQRAIYGAPWLAMNLPWLAFVNISFAVMILLRNTCCLHRQPVGASIT
jgi:hypothetical protein